MYLCVVTILGGLLCWQVSGNTQLDTFQSDQTGLSSKRIIPSSNEMPLTEAPESPAVAITDDHNTNLEEEHTTKVADAALKLSAHFFADSQEKTKSILPNSDASDLQSTGMHHTKDSVEPVGGWKRNFRDLFKRTEQIPKCPCTYKELRVLMNAIRDTEYVLEDVLLYLKRNKKLEKTVLNLFKSVDRTLHGTRL
ncbi:hypothetical protein CRM22_000074 [Opisthorchis felineus]|uniref:Uncharacterized protein n=1 Tax=Opisthorchis felineus TaxID=147828 RepID=A0A4S2MNR8_OPIFE|nr:hypothetical protein CRM22_000074 [Opisthorchis felineus]